jgi:CHAT domain-containing protein/tetratricopeptide (TPR) repeat protein
MLYGLSMLSLALALALVVQAPGESARQILRTATAAVRGDSAERVARRWHQRLARDSSDRAAALGLAVIRVQQYDHRAAESLLVRVLRPDERPRDQWGAYALRTRSKVYTALFRLPQADSALALTIEVARELGLNELVVNAGGARAQLLSRTRGVRAGQDQLAATRASLARNDREGQALLTCIEAEFLFRQGDVAGLAKATSGREIALAAGATQVAAMCDWAIAQHWLNRGNPQEALRWFETSADLMRRARDYEALAVAQQWHGYVQASGGAFSGARASYDEAIRAATISKSGSPRAWATLGLGGIAQWTGDLRMAATHTGEARRMFSAQRDRVGLATALTQDAGIAQRAGDLEGAARIYGELLTMQRELGAKNAIPAIERELAVVAMKSGQLEEAERHLDEVERVAREQNAQGWLRSDLPFHRGDLALRRRQWARAESLFTVARDAAGNVGYARHQVELRLALARLSLGDAAGGEQALDNASRALETWRGSLSDKDLRLAVVQTDQSWGSVNDSWPTAIALLARAGRGESAFAFAEAGRARELRDRGIRAAVWRATTATTPRPTARAARNPATSREVQRTLDDSTAVLLFVIGRQGEPNTVFAIAASGTRAIVLPALDSLSRDVERFTRLLESGATPRELATRLGESLVSDAIAALPRSITRLIVVPDGPLHRLPFDALVLASGDWAAMRYAITLAPSATVATALASRPRDGRGRTLLAFGDPVFAGEQSAAASPSVRLLREGFTATGGLARLPASGVEAARVGQYGTGGVVRLRSGATEAFFKRESARRLSVLHLATHALVDDRAYGRSAIALAASASDDGFLTVNELGSLRLDAELVVLSACRTAGGVLLDGEGVRGLTAPLLESGARAVVATYWAIGDRSALPIIDRFYAELARGIPAAEALQRVKVEAIRAGVSPRDWAAFTIVGDGAVRPQLRPVRARPIPWVIATR